MGLGRSASQLSYRMGKRTDKVTFRCRFAPKNTNSKAKLTYLYLWGSILEPWALKRFFHPTSLFCLWKGLFLLRTLFLLTLDMWSSLLACHLILIPYINYVDTVILYSFDHMKRWIHSLFCDAVYELAHLQHLFTRTTLSSYYSSLSLCFLWLLIGLKI